MDFQKSAAPHFAGVLVCPMQGVSAGQGSYPGFMNQAMIQRADILFHVPELHEARIRRGRYVDRRLGIL